MSAKHKRPFYVFAAVAAVCVVMLGVRSSAHDGGPDNPVPLASDGAEVPQSGGELSRQTPHGNGNGNGRHHAVATVFTFGFLTPAEALAAVDAKQHAPLIGPPTIWRLPGFDGELPLGVPDPEGDVRDVKGHETEDPSDPPEQTDEPSTDPPPTDSTQGPETPDSTPESDPTGSDDPASGPGDFSDPGANGQSGGDSSEPPSAPPTGD